MLIENGVSAETETLDSTAEENTLDTGREAWSRIKESGKKMREDWLCVGRALIVGRDIHTKEGSGLNKKAFGQWCASNGFSDISQEDRTAAIWLAQNWEAIQALCLDAALCHPRALRNAYNKKTKESTSSTTEEKAPSAAAAADPNEAAAPAEMAEPVEAVAEAAKPVEVEEQAPKPASAFQKRYSTPRTTPAERKALVREVYAAMSVEETCEELCSALDPEKLEKLCSLIMERLHPAPLPLAA